MAEKANAAPDKWDENLLNYNPSNISSDWPLSASNLTSSSMGRISSVNFLESYSGSTATTVGSSCPTMWDQLSSTPNLGFSDVNIRQGASFPNALGIRPVGLEPSRPGLDCIAGFGWTPPNAMLKGGVFLPDTSEFLPPSLAQIPADSGFIERAARYSCFSSGSFGDIANPFSIPESAYLEDIAGRGLKLTSRTLSRRNEMKMAGSSRCVGLPAEPGASERCPHKNEKASEDMVRSIDEAKPNVSDPSKDSDEAEYSGCGGQEELESAARDGSSKQIDSKKRKRCSQDAEPDRGQSLSEKQPEAMKDRTEHEQKGKQTPTSGKPGGKNAKQGPGSSDSPKGEYVHVRARRGQATNSHSLAERVRREKISERMKFLQDLVPGCSKVTGKAVMLDEIINYVQSLQRQVEFLSMKLATVNPLLDSNLERILAKDILQSRIAPSSSLFPHVVSMGSPQLHQLQGIVQAGTQTLGGSVDPLRRSMIPSFTATGGGYKELLSHVTSVWEDELHNVVHMGLNSTAPPCIQDASGSLPSGHMKAEP